MKTKKWQKPTGVVIGLVAMTMLFVMSKNHVNAAEVKYVCKLAHPNPETAPTQKKALFVKKLWEQVTNGRVTLMIFPQGQLYKSGPECLDAASLGAIQMSLAPAAWLENRDPEWAIAGMSFLIDDPKHWLRAEKTPYVVALKKRLETSAHLKLFSNMVFVGNQIFTKKPITKLEDLKGVKIRAFGPVQTKTFERLGAVPLDIAGPEVAVALQTGSISAVSTSLNKGYIQTFGLVENCPNVLLTPLGYNLGFWAINTDWWNGLPADIQKALEGTSDQIRDEVLKIEAEDESDTLKWALQAGMKTTKLSAQEAARFRERLAPLYSEYTSTLGTGFIDAINKTR